MSAQEYFRGKRIAVIGLGHNGAMVEDVKFLIKAGALVALYDLRSEARLKCHLVFLRSIGLANYVCGSIPGEDLLDMDMIILSREYPRDSSFLKAVNERNFSVAAGGSKAEEEPMIPVEYPETLFFRRSPPVVVVGLIGQCGKSTVASLLAPMLESACAKTEGQGFFAVDPESGDGLLANLKKIRNGDIVLMKFDESVIAELHRIRISPQVAVFASMPDSSPGIEPFEVLDFQTYNNFIIASDEIIDRIHSLRIQPKAKMLRTKASIIPEEWKFAAKGVHDLENAALAVQTARLFKVGDDEAEKILSSWKPLKGRIESVKKVRGVEYLNDSASVKPCSTMKSLETVGRDRRVILILGGSRGNGHYDYRPLYESLPKSVGALILLPGSGTISQRKAIASIEGLEIKSAPSIEEAVRLAAETAKKGDVVLFSPGFEAVADGSRKERGERFVRAVRGL